MAQLSANYCEKQAAVLRQHIADGTRNYGYKKNTAEFFRAVQKELNGDMPDAIDYVDSVLHDSILKAEVLSTGEAQRFEGKDMFDLAYETRIKIPMPSFGRLPVNGIILTYGRDESGWAQIDISKY